MLLADSVPAEDSSRPVDGRFLSVSSRGFALCTSGRSGWEGEREKNPPLIRGLALLDF